MTYRIIHFVNSASGPDFNGIEDIGTKDRLEESRKLIPPGWEISSLNEEYSEDITIYDEEGNIVEKYRRMVLEPQQADPK